MVIKMHLRDSIAGQVHRLSETGERESGVRWGEGECYAGMWHAISTGLEASVEFQSSGRLN